MNNFERCKVCNIPLKQADRTLWCKVRDCPETKQRHPTEQQVKEFNIGERNARAMG